MLRVSKIPNKPSQIPQDITLRAGAEQSLPEEIPYDKELLSEEKESDDRIQPQLLLEDDETVSDGQKGNDLIPV